MSYFIYLALTRKYLVIVSQFVSFSVPNRRSVATERRRGRGLNFPRVVTSYHLCSFPNGERFEGFKLCIVGKVGVNWNKLVDEFVNYWAQR